MDTRARPDEDGDLDREYPFPKPGDTLLRMSGRKTLYTQSLSGNWAVYTDSYRDAADRLVDGIEGLAHEDALYCPIVFLYRHFFELELKPIARSIQRTSGRPIPNCVDTKHSVLELWRYIKENITYLNCEIHQPTIDVLTELVKELDSLDPDSMHTRYPSDKKGKELQVTVYSLDMENMKDVVASMRNALETIAEAIGLEEEWRSEQDSW